MVNIFNDGSNHRILIVYGNHRTSRIFIANTFRRGEHFLYIKTYMFEKKSYKPKASKIHNFEIHKNEDISLFKIQEKK